MPVSVQHEPEDKLVRVHITGKLSDEDYQNFVPLVEQWIREHGSVNMLVVLADFEGWEMSALWEDVKFDFQHFSDIDRLAIVGESKWEKGMSVFCKPFTSAEVKYFEHSDIAAAETWVRG